MSVFVCLKASLEAIKSLGQFTLLQIKLIVSSFDILALGGGEPLISLHGSDNI